MKLNCLYLSRVIEDANDNKPFIFYSGHSIGSFKSIKQDGLKIGNTSPAVQSVGGIYMSSLVVAIGYAFGYHSGYPSTIGVVWHIYVSDYEVIRIDEDVYNGIIPEKLHKLLPQDDIDFLSMVKKQENNDDFGFSNNPKDRQRQIGILKKLKAYANNIIVSENSIGFTGPNRILNYWIVKHDKANERVIFYDENSKPVKIKKWNVSMWRDAYSDDPHKILR